MPQELYSLSSQETDSFSTVKVLTKRLTQELTNQPGSSGCDD